MVDSSKGKDKQLSENFILSFCMNVYMLNFTV